MSGYAPDTPFRDHEGDYGASSDMEDTSQTLWKRQGEVPRLPVPDLTNTFDMLLRSATPHCTSEKEAKELQEAIHDFLAPGGLGETLQGRLLKRRTQYPDSSWFINWWNDYAYLTYRETVVWNVTYALQFADERPKMMRQTNRAARFTRHALDFWLDVSLGRLAPNTTKKGAPMSSTQFRYMFNSCRMPREKKDFAAHMIPQGIPM